jgi:hypothetical protein
MQPPHHMTVKGVRLGHTHFPSLVPTVPSHEGGQVWHWLEGILGEGEQYLTFALMMVFSYSPWKTCLSWRAADEVLPQVPRLLILHSASELDLSVTASWLLLSDSLFVPGGGSYPPTPIFKYKLVWTTIPRKLPSSLPPSFIPTEELWSM